MAGISVLLVDNEPEVLASLEALLRRWEMPAISASSTIEANSILARTRVDWAIVDYALGGPETGLDWILRIRDEFPALRIALFTAETDPDLPTRCKQAGIRFLKKPLKPAALRALLSVPVDASRPPESA
jgi:DNA-binding response OmpR family regulator